MIRLIFSDPTKTNPFGIIKAEIVSESLNIGFSWDSPLDFRITSTVDKKIKWSSKIHPGNWSYFVEPCNTLAEILDAEGNVLLRWEWDTLLHGDESHVLFMLWCLKNKGAKGIAIGTHDGTTGEWVHPTREGHLKGFLVEASVPQYIKLVDNYKNIEGVYPILSLVTPEGGYTTFFEGGEGHTNSTVPNYTSGYIGEESVSSKVLPSRSLNSLILELGLEKDLKWLHLDVEGIDADLILSLDEDLVILPEIIIYESVALAEEKKEEIGRWLSEKSYSFHESGWNTIALRNNVK
jgi:hypothetical protein